MEDSFTNLIPARIGEIIGDYYHYHHHYHYQMR